MGTERWRYTRALDASRLADCPDSRELERAILAMTPGVLQAAACLRCGTVCVVERLCEEPRPHDVRLTGNRVVQLPGELLDWIGAWPRVLGSPWLPKTGMFLPSAIRVVDPAELQQLEQQQRLAQSALPERARLRLAGVPVSPPPDGLPSALSYFAAIWHELQLPG